MKKATTLFLVTILTICNLLVLFSCKKNELSVKFVDDTVYARFNSGIPGITSSYMPYNSAISFEEYEKGSAKCPSRSYCYARFVLSFNDTPKGYKAYELYDIDYVTIDNKSQGCRSREGEKNNQIEIIVWLPYYTTQSTHTIQSVTFTSFDSVKGENVQKTIEVDYDFESTVVSNWVNRFNKETTFNATLIQSSDEKITFSVDTSINYDKLIYNVTERGKYQYSSEFDAIVNEELFDKSDIYTYNANDNQYYSYIEVAIVGYQKDGINYYFSPVIFSTY